MQATDTGARSHGYEAKAEPHRTGNTLQQLYGPALWSIPEGMHECMDEFKYRQVNRGSGSGLLEVYWGWTDAASAGDLEEVY